MGCKFINGFFVGGWETKAIDYRHAQLEKKYFGLLLSCILCLNDSSIYSWNILNPLFLFQILARYQLLSGTDELFEAKFVFVNHNMENIFCNFDAISNRLCKHWNKCIRCIQCLNLCYQYMWVGCLCQPFNIVGYWTLSYQTSHVSYPSSKLPDNLCDP